MIVHIYGVYCVWIHIDSVLRSHLSIIDHIWVVLLCVIKNKIQNRKVVSFIFHIDGYSFLCHFDFFLFCVEIFLCDRFSLLILCRLGARSHLWAVHWARYAKYYMGSDNRLLYAPTCTAFKRTKSVLEEIAKLKSQEVSACGLKQQWVGFELQRLESLFPLSGRIVFPVAF